MCFIPSHRPHARRWSVADAPLQTLKAPNCARVCVQSGVQDADPLPLLPTVPDEPRHMSTSKLDHPDSSVGLSTLGHILRRQLPPSLVRL